MYDRDPRHAWTPTIAHYFHRQPEQMGSYTPAELDAVVKTAKRIDKDAASAASAGRSRTRS